MKINFRRAIYFLNNSEINLFIRIRINIEDNPDFISDRLRLTTTPPMTTTQPASYKYSSSFSFNPCIPYESEIGRSRFSKLTQI